MGPHMHSMARSVSRRFLDEDRKTPEGDRQDPSASSGAARSRPSQFNIICQAFLLAATGEGSLHHPTISIVFQNRHHICDYFFLVKNNWNKSGLASASRESIWTKYHYVKNYSVLYQWSEL